jgi:hypothetical protein
MPPACLRRVSAATPRHHGRCRRDSRQRDSVLQPGGRKPGTGWPSCCVIEQSCHVLASGVRTGGVLCARGPGLCTATLDDSLRSEPSAELRRGVQRGLRPPRCVADAAEASCSSRNCIAARPALAAASTLAKLAFARLAAREAELSLWRSPEPTSSYCQGAGQADAVSTQA